MSILLIHPPVVKPSEPPAGIARLSGALRRAGVPCSIVDANMEGLLSLMKSPKKAGDKWTRRAVNNRSRHLSSLTSLEVCGNFDRYKRAVMDLNRLLEISAAANSTRVGLANYQHAELSPVRSADLIRAAENPEENPFYPYFRKRLSELVDARQPSIVGFSLNFLSQALCTFSMLGFLRREFPEMTLLLGGGLVTSWLRKPDWGNPFGGLIDHLIAGPGERALISIARCDIPEEIHFRPDYNYLSRNGYLAPGPILPYSSSSGCYWNRCSFCPERAEGNPYLPIPVERVMDDLHHLAKETQPALIHILDNAVSPKLMSSISTNPPGIPWYGFARVTHHLTDMDFCMALKRSGCVMLKLGLESGDQHVLDSERKGMEIDTASLALKALKKAGIATYVYLLFGTPSETLIEARRTLEFTVRHGQEIHFLNLAIFNLPIHSPQALNLETEMMYEGDLSLYTGFRHPRGWHRGLVRQFLDKEFKRHPIVAPILRRDPPFFTSNHAPFFCMPSGLSSRSPSPHGS